jgi:ribose transport system permease protein
MFGAFSIARPSLFPTGVNIAEIANEVTITGVIACGLTMALVAQEFDLSIGYVASFAGVLVTGLMGFQHLSIAEAVIVTLGVCAGIGLINGLIVTKAGVNSFIATLGIGTAVIGLNYAYNSGVPVTLNLPDRFLSLSVDSFLGVHIPVYLLAALAIVLWIVLNRTILGQHIQAVGGNVEAARLSGVRIHRTKILTFIMSATCAGAGGILLASKLGSGQSAAGDGYLLNAFAAAFVGSVALRDGEFHILGTIIGVIIVGVGVNGLAVIGAPTFWQYMFEGCLLVGAVALSTIAKRIAAE